MAFNYQLLDKDFNRAVNEAIKEVDSLRVPFTTIINSWFKSNAFIFKGNPGKYEDLAESTKKAKIRKYGSAYPVLVASGYLRESLTSPGHTDSIAKILNNTSMVLGSSVKYGGYLQFGTKRMPARPWLLLGPEQVAPGPINNRKEIWIKTITDYVAAVLKKRGLPLNG